MEGTAPPVDPARAPVFGVPTQTPEVNLRAALRYLDDVKAVYGGNSEVYKSFLATLLKFRNHE